jgi:hypothetical protein
MTTGRAGFLRLRASAGCQPPHRKDRCEENAPAERFSRESSSYACSCLCSRLPAAQRPAKPRARRRTSTSRRRRQRASRWPGSRRGGRARCQPDTTCIGTAVGSPLPRAPRSPSRPSIAEPRMPLVSLPSIAPAPGRRWPRSRPARRCALLLHPRRLRRLRRHPRLRRTYRHRRRRQAWSLRARPGAQSPSRGARRRTTSVWPATTSTRTARPRGTRR